MRGLAESMGQCSSFRRHCAIHPSRSKSAVLPGYALTLIDPRIKRSLDRKAPAPSGRTPLKSYEVFFFRTDRLNRLPMPDQVPTIEELGDDL
jgi:hypothetical protein